MEVFQLLRPCNAAVASLRTNSRTLQRTGIPFTRLRTARSSARLHRCAHRIVACAGNGAVKAAHYDFLEKIECDLNPFPHCEFFRVEGIVRPWRIRFVVDQLSDNGILGMTVTQVAGAGVQGGKGERYGGTEHGMASLIEKSKLEVVCLRSQVNIVVRIIATAAHTGEIGDGKIFVVPIAEVVRIRTGETGAVAERMEGGMMDMKQEPGI
uniref:Putative nitrogen regulatory protein n=1 Tax=Lobosphaera incisa TaxID=312850 RepID=A0A2R4H197_9CHLO|nr:putative nitrogen regulatory protein [Lobosphaera incisa]